VTEPRPQRPCKGCTVTDDHPRHVIGVITIGATSTEFNESWHLDCHATAGCDSCSQRLTDADGRHGDALIPYFAGLRNGDTHG
jgi:hypothetical protein